MKFWLSLSPSLFLTHTLSLSRYLNTVCTKPWQDVSCSLISVLTIVEAIWKWIGCVSVRVYTQERCLWIFNSEHLALHLSPEIKLQESFSGVHFILNSCVYIYFPIDVQGTEIFSKFIVNPNVYIYLRGA